MFEDNFTAITLLNLLISFFSKPQQIKAKNSKRIKRIKCGHCKKRLHNAEVVRYGCIVNISLKKKKGTQDGFKVIQH